MSWCCVQQCSVAPVFDVCREGKADVPSPQDAVGDLAKLALDGRLHVQDLGLDERCCGMSALADRQMGNEEAYIDGQDEMAVNVREPAEKL